jgi:hypothetical protein
LLEEEEENEETDAYSEDLDQMPEDDPQFGSVKVANPSKTQSQWGFHHNNSVTRRMLKQSNGAIEECANEEDILSNSNKENAEKQQQEGSKNKRKGGQI